MTMDKTNDVTLTNETSIVVPVVPAVPAAVVPIDDDNDNDRGIVRSDGPYITLIGSDDKQYQISKSAAMHSVFIKDSLGLDDDENEEDIDDSDNNTKKEENLIVSQDADYNNDNDEHNEHNEHQQQQQQQQQNEQLNMIINVLRVKGKCLQKVIEFLTYYTHTRMDDIPRLLDGTTFDSVIKQEWYRNYIYNILDSNDTDNDDTDDATSTNNIDTDENDSTTTIDNDNKETATIENFTSKGIATDEEVTTKTTSSQINTISNNNNNNTDSNSLMYIFPKNRRILLELLAAANYMTIKPLLELICLWVSFQLQGKTHEQIRQFLYFPQITPDEEEHARKKLPWIFEEKML